MADDLARASVRISPDLTGFTEDLRASLEKATAGATGQVKVDADTTQLDEAEARMTAFGGTEETATARVNTDTGSLDEADAQLDEFGLKRETATADVNTGDSGDKLSTLSSQMDSAGGAGGALMGSLALLAPAFVPLGAAAVGVGGALTAGFAAGGIALGAFALVAEPSLKLVSTAATTLLTAQNSYNTALANGVPAWQAAGAAQAAYKKAMDGLTPTQQQMTLEVLSFKDAWQQVQTQNAPAILSVLSGAVGDAKVALGSLTPLVQSVTPALDELAAHAKVDLNSPAFHDFVGWVQTEGAPAILDMVHTVGNFASGLATMFERFSPLLHTVEGDLVNMSDHFKNFAAGSGFGQFLAYAQTELPVVGQFLKQAGDALMSLAKDASGAGSFELPILVHALGLLNDILQLPGIGPAIVDIGLLGFAASKLVGPVQSAVAIFGKFSSVIGPAGVAGAAEDATTSSGHLSGAFGKVGAAASGANTPLIVAAAGFVGLTELGHALSSKLDAVTLSQDKNAIAFGTGATNVAQLSAASVGLQSQMGSVNNILGSVTLSGQGFSGVLAHIASAFGESQPTTAQMTQELNKLHDAYQANQAAISTYNTNVGDLSSKFHISNQDVKVLAQSLGIDLTKALNPQQFNEFSQTIQTDMHQTGGISGVMLQTVSQNMQLMALHATNAATNTHEGVTTALTPLVSDLVSIGQNSTAGFIQQYINAETQAGNASKNIHDRSLSPLVPLEVEMLQTGDVSGANFVAKLVAQIGPAGNAGKGLHDVVANAVALLVPDMLKTGDTAGLNYVNSLVAHSIPAMTAGKSLHDQVVNVLDPLEQQLQQVGDTSGAAFVQALINHDQDAMNAGTQLATAVAQGLQALGPLVSQAMVKGLNPITNPATPGVQSTFYGGAHAEGGPVVPGFHYLVGERGPELFVTGNLPHFASGGDFPAGTAAVVGENGPEVFASGTAGQIIPNSAMGQALWSPAASATALAQAQVHSTTMVNTLNQAWVQSLANTRTFGSNVTQALQATWTQVQGQSIASWNQLYQQLSTTNSQSLTNTRTYSSTTVQALNDAWTLVRSQSQALWDATYESLVTHNQQSQTSTQSYGQQTQDSLHNAWTSVQDSSQSIWSQLQSSLADHNAGMLSDTTNSVTQAHDRTITAYTDMGNQVPGVVGSMWTKVGASYKTGIDQTITSLDTFLKGINTVGGQVGWSVNLNVPMLSAGGVSDGPAAIVGEGDPKYPEFVIPTDPKYKGRAKGLLGGAAQALAGMADGGVVGDPTWAALPASSTLGGFPGAVANALGPKALTALQGHEASFAAANYGSGLGGPGSISPAQVAAFWIAAGGSPGAAGIMARIAYSESGDQPGIVQQGQPYATTGWGLWQITPGDSVPSVGVNEALLNPLTNARAALAKYTAAGGLQPWTGDPAVNALGGVAAANAVAAQVFDQGGWLPTGASIAVNNTGRPERVMGPSEGGAQISVVINGADLSDPGMVKAAAEQGVTDAFDKGRRMLYAEGVRG